MPAGSGPVAVALPRAGRLDAALAEAGAGWTRSQVARWIRDGRVTLGGRVVARPAEPVAAGAIAWVEVPPPVPSALEAQDLPLRVVHEDAHLAVIDKAPGMVVHPAAGHADGTLVNALLHHLDDLSGVGGEERPGLVHRLDRDTSGLLVVAKHDVAHRALAAQFAAHTAGREYLALVHDPPRADAGTAESRLARHPTDRLRQASTRDGTGRRAVTHWRVCARAGTVGLVACRLETGRTHQVRVHLAELGSPILGDALYARRGASPLPASLRGRVDRCLLHAFRLAFDHPADGGRRVFVAEPWPDVAAALDALGLPTRLGPLAL